uniref:Ubiquitin-like domain-containing protein n=1 Tax=Neogobius melanostomus TaxID=47308 RepID=A0A8C6U1I0_9GOBI
MKVLICFEGSFVHYNVSPEITVKSLKQMKTLLLQLDEDQHVHHYLEMRYCGAALWDNWTLRDVSFTSGRTIRCSIKREQKPIIYILNAVVGETIPIIGTPAMLHMSVGQLKSIVSAQSGLPVSVFRLSTDNSVELYDCNNLQDYDLEAGTCIHLDTWNGWLEFLQGCLLGSQEPSGIGVSGSWRT